MKRILGAVAPLLGAAVLLGAATGHAQETLPAADVLPVVAAPVAISIPRIDVDAVIVPLGLEADGALAAPQDPDTVGWFDAGPGVGGAGNMLLDGHVDWGGQTRVFGRLRTLAPGDTISLTDQLGNVAAYGVQWTRFYPDADTAPLDEIYDTSPVEQVTLITCGGTFDPVSRMYRGRWIVRATPLSAD